MGYSVSVGIPLVRSASEAGDRRQDSVAHWETLINMR